MSLILMTQSEFLFSSPKVLLFQTALSKCTNSYCVFRQKVLSHPKCTAAVRQTCFSKDGRYVSLWFHVKYSRTSTRGHLPFKTSLPLLLAQLPGCLPGCLCMVILTRISVASLGILFLRCLKLRDVTKTKIFKT